MYEKDGEKYFIVDSHMHYWSAGPDNWVKGAEQYAKGWIECFHAYQGLGRAQRLVGVEALDPALGVLLLALDPVLRARVPEVAVAVQDEVLLSVGLVHG